MAPSPNEDVNMSRPQVTNDWKKAMQAVSKRYKTPNSSTSADHLIEQLFLADIEKNHTFGLPSYISRFAIFPDKHRAHAQPPPHAEIRWGPTPLNIATMIITESPSIGKPGEANKVLIVTNTSIHHVFHAGHMHCNPWIEGYASSHDYKGYTVSTKDGFCCTADSWRLSIDPVASRGLLGLLEKEEFIGRSVSSISADAKIRVKCQEYKMTFIREIHDARQARGMAGPWSLSSPKDAGAWLEKRY